MNTKINIAIFAQSRDLSNLALIKLLKFKKLLNLFLVVSDVKFKKILIKNRFKNFYWINNKKRNSQKIINFLKKNKHEENYAFSFQHKWRVEKSIIKIFKYFINFHYGDLPKYRGHNPVIHAILNKEKYLKGTIHTIDENLDRGKIIKKVIVKNSHNTSYDLEKKITIKFVQYLEILMLKFLKKKQIRLKKIINNKKYKFNSIKDINSLKEIKNFKELFVKSLAFDYPPHEPAYIKINNIKIYLKLNFKPSK